MFHDDVNSELEVFLYFSIYSLQLVPKMNLEILIDDISVERFIL